MPHDSKSRTHLFRANRRARAITLCGRSSRCSGVVRLPLAVVAVPAAPPPAVPSALTPLRTRAENTEPAVPAAPAVPTAPAAAAALSLARPTASAACCRNLRPHARGAGRCVCRLRVVLNTSCMATVALCGTQLEACLPLPSVELAYLPHPRPHLSATFLHVPTASCGLLPGCHRSAVTVPPSPNWRSVLHSCRARGRGRGRGRGRWGRAQRTRPRCTFVGGMPPCEGCIAGKGLDKGLWTGGPSHSKYVVRM